MKFRLFVAVFFFVLARSAAQVATPFALTDLSGKVQELAHNDSREVRAFVFLTTECPIARASMPQLNALSDAYKHVGKPVRLFGVLADSGVTRTAAIRHFQSFKATFPILFDSLGQLQGVFEPTHVPEVFVLDGENRLVYRGAIDNGWLASGHRRPQAERHYLAEAVDATLAGKTVPQSKYMPVGCVVERMVRKKTDAVTYSRHIAPILYSRCVSCHRAGQVAPFPLMTYEDAAKRASQIALVTEQRLMPPWIPAPNHTRFVGERGVTPTEQKLLKTWAGTGRARGNPEDLPPSPRFADGWRLGKPDLVVKMAGTFSVPAEGPDILQHFVIPIPISEDKMVAAIEFRPGNRRVAHHAVLFLDENGMARKLDAATPELGYGGLAGPGFLPSGALGGWSVGNSPRRLPDDMGRYLKRGSDLVLQVHYHPSGKTETDQSEVGIYFTRASVAQSLRKPAKLVGSIWLSSYVMDIPAGERNFRATATYTLPKPTIMVGVVPHMHLLGKSMRVDAFLPDGTRKTLIDIPRWDYNWQDEYYYERPFSLPAKTRLEVNAIFDNSEMNPSNPSIPPKRVTWGEGTLDEMLFCFFLLASPRMDDLMAVIYDNLAHDAIQPRSTVRR